MVTNISYHELRLRIPESWEVADDGAGGEPLTLVKPEGVGALQFSLAIYVGGDIPAITLQHLNLLLDAFAEEHGFRPAEDRWAEQEPMIVGGTFIDGNDFIRAWYFSDGVNTGFATYNCALDDGVDEVGEAEVIVRTAQFVV
jgi:hypothetical protein